VLIAVAALLGAAVWLRASASLISAPQDSRLDEAMNKAEGKVAHHHKGAANESHSHNGSKSSAHNPHHHADKSHEGKSRDKAHHNKTEHHHKTVAKTTAKSTTESTGVTTTSTVIVVADTDNNIFSAVTRWEGWGAVFPWVVTSTSTTTTTTTTTTTYTGTTTFTTTTTSRTTTTTSTSTTTTFTNTTTTTSTTTPCIPVEDGDACYVEVMKTLHGVRITPDSFGSLTSWSTFEEVQEYLHMSGFPDCSMPCKCETAKVGDDCYTSVMWVYWHGFDEHPEWYPNLNKDSGFEAVQAHVHKDGQCPTPCRPQYTDERASLFCFAIIRPSGYERQIAEFQLKMGIGVFGCDGHAILSSKNFTIGDANSSKTVQTLPFHPAKVGVSKDGTAANTLLFLHAWTVVKDKTNALEHDWILKVDPDAVLLPDRIQKHLAPHTGSKSYVRNCNSQPQSEDFPMMFGSLEVLSKGAAKAFFSGGEQECRKTLDWQTWGEDYFLGKCMLHLEVTPIDNFDIISDGVCTGVDCDDGLAGAFHPFKDLETWSGCWRQATRNGEMTLQPLPAAA
jgi:hypothetical protein